MQNTGTWNGCPTWACISSYKTKRAAFFLLLAILFAPAARAEKRAEVFPNIYLAQGKGQALRTGVGFRSRLWATYPSGWGFVGHLEWEIHPLAPTFTVAFGKRFSGDNAFFELAAGVWIGAHVGMGFQPTVIPALGYHFTQRFYVNVPAIFRWDQGLYRPMFMPYLGMRL